MSDIKAFLKQNKEVKENVKVVVSDGFKDEKGKPIPFEIKALTAMEDEAIRNACMRKVQVTGKKNQFTNELDSNRYVRLLCTNSVVFPNLKDAELQDSYPIRWHKIFRLGKPQPQRYDYSRQNRKCTHKTCRKSYKINRCRKNRCRCTRTWNGC